MNEAVIVGYIRSPFHFANKGELIRVRPDDLAAAVVKALIARTGVDPKDIEDLLLGCAFPEAEQGFNLAKIVGQLAQLPVTVAGATVNRGLVPDPQTRRYAISMAVTLLPALTLRRSVEVLAGHAWAGVLGPQVQTCRLPEGGTPVRSKADGRLYAKEHGPLQSTFEQDQHGN